MVWAASPALSEPAAPGQDPAEESAVERTVLRPGEIGVRVRNLGPAPVTSPRSRWPRPTWTSTFLAVDAYLEGTEIAESGSGAFGGTTLLFAGAGVSYLGLVALDRWLRDRRAGGASPGQLALLVAAGIGFALHNTTEGLAVVAPLSADRGTPVARLGLLGVIAGGPAIVG
jgi:hypothetical protein